MPLLFRRSLVAATAAVATAAAAIAVATFAGSATAAQATRGGPAKVRHEIRHDASPPLSGLAPVRPGQGDGENEKIRRMPNHGGRATTDPVVQSTPGSRVSATGASFDGVGQGFTGPAGTFAVQFIPPDTNAAVGRTQIVEIVNTGFAVLSKTGQALFGPAGMNTLFAGFGGGCENTNDGDGVVRYDALADRWLITQFADADSGPPFLECVAVSRTGDATGAWNRYSFQFDSFPDYPKLSVWPDAYYMTYNLFGPSSFEGAEVCGMDRRAMLAGAAATQQCNTTSPDFGGLLAADFEGGLAPPVGEANTIVAMGATSTTLAVWKFHVDFARPGRSTFTGPANLTVARFTPACGANGTCVPQKGTGQTLDSLSDRLMFRLAYRNFGDHESLVTNHAVTARGGSGIRWYELRMNAGSAPTVFQQGTFAPDRTFRWMGSIAMDKTGNIGVGYSASSTTINPQIRFTGRLAGDPAGQMTQAETTIVAGGGSQTTFSRWGDYSSMVVDPTDGCTFWYAQEYLNTTGARNWRTRLASFSLPGCA